MTCFYGIPTAREDGEDAKVRWRRSIGTIAKERLHDDERAKSKK